MTVLFAQILQQETDLNMIIQTLFSFAFIVYLFYAQRLQSLQMLNQIEATLRRLKKIRDEARGISINAINEVGKPGVDISAKVDRIMEFISIPLTEMDPYGIVDKLDHYLKVNHDIFEAEVKAIAPNAAEVERQNLENLVGLTFELNYIYKAMRHNYLMGKKTMNIYIILQVHMILPLIMQLVESLTVGIQATREGIPIGDSVGPIVAGRLMKDYPKRDISKEMVSAEVPFDGRTLIVMKAKGPGGTVGTPDEAIMTALNEKEGKVKIIIMIDAAGKMEGEPVGAISEGVGAAIGGTGKEKFKIEEITVKYKVPIHAIAIKQGMEHTMAPLVEELAEGAEKAGESVKRIIMDYSQPGDIVIVAGIGNTIGVGQ
ncbi:DUF1512 domain-containing protein [Candidatus Bathyarchaeota archaeon]|nr:DUF1512 domain-containing protein [Candidatus Bathyarchaeota archaeon]